MLLGLLRLPIELLWIAFHVLVGVADIIARRNRRRFESTVLIKAPRDAVWPIMAADRVLFDGPPALEMADESLPDGDGLRLTRVTLADVVG